MAKKGIISSFGDKLDELLKIRNRKQNIDIYNESSKRLDLTKLISTTDLTKILAGFGNENMNPMGFEKFFDVALDRNARYTEYEQIFYRIPEAAKAIQIYVDGILAPNIGMNDQQIYYNVDRSNKNGKMASILLQTLFEKTDFYSILPQIIFTTLLYGDCFLELDKTQNGIRYIVHSPVNCTLLHDSRTDIELGLIIKKPLGTGMLADMLSKVYPSLKIEMPSKDVTILSKKCLLASNIYNSNVHTSIFNRIQSQVRELVKDVYADSNTEIIYLAPHRYVRFPVYFNNLYYPYGTSVFDSVRSIAKQLLIIESALAIYRATRTPMRTLWSIEVGSTPSDGISGLASEIMDRVRRQKVIDSDGGTITSIPDMMSIEEDIWTPCIDGVPLLKADPIMSGDISPFIGDADYFKKKLLSALGIPPAYLAEEQAASTRSLLSMEDINWSRSIKKYQKGFNDALFEFSNLCLALTGNSDMLNIVKPTLPEPKTIEDNIRVENLGQRLSVADSFMSSFPNVPKLWVLKKIIGIDDNSIDEMRDLMIEQKGLSNLFSEQVPGSMQSDGSISGGGFGSDLEGIDGFSDEMGNEDFSQFDNITPQQDLDLGEENTKDDEKLENNNLSSPLGPLDLDSLDS